MTSSARVLEPLAPRSRVPRSVLLVIVIAWSLAVVAYATGSEHALHHDALIEHGPPLWAAALLFLLAWQAMIAAMMLPSTLPLVRLFTAATLRQERRRLVLTSFLGGYSAVWSAFGLVAFVDDVGVHRTVDAWPWLAARSWLIGGSALLAAGLFQFTGLKDRCLAECRQPGAFLLAHYRRGRRGGFELGVRHGIFCLGCCWALMLVMFAAGVAVLWWMAALTAVMVYEKTGRNGRRLSPGIGIALLALSGLAFAHPSWFPTPFTS